MRHAAERSVRIREVEGSNPFRSTKNKPPARVDLFLPWACGSRSLCPERVNPFRPTRHSEPSGNWIILNFPFLSVEENSYSRLCKIRNTRLLHKSSASDLFKYYSVVSP